MVSFSGGRDSSAILAVAAAVARREGLPPPIAVSQRFTGVDTAEESRWQEMVIAEAKVVDWERLELTTELDVVGPLARDLISRHGVLWPANTMFHAPIAALARGGTLVTGFGGDEIMSPGWAWERLNRVLSRQVRPRRGDLIEVAGAIGPPALRRRVLARRPDPSAPSPWLRPHAERAVRRAWEDLRVAEPVHHGKAIRWWWSSRYMSTTLQSLGLLASGYGASILHPFADPRFLTAVARERGRNGPRSRSQSMIGLFSDVLPEQTLVRVGKASFNGAFLGPETRSFAKDWDGSGVDPSYVDVEVLRDIWRTEDPDARSYPLFQAAWAATVMPSSASGTERVQ
nr:asparagine synthase-related protein [Blastococcus aurantiacus]